ncbi:MAG: N-acetylmuramoyl-L-alanine amidase [candidate division TM6 bacterium GW2011_GWF2_28_16]|nr:MAG: N-acetylmuramoyl-L-alanine amidase [candidate division TM6 bacterium GW2011_GWF2_28_16]
MEKRFINLLYFLLININFLNVNCAVRTRAINTLKTAEVCKNRFAPHLFLEFTDTLYFEKNIYPEKNQLELVFPAMDLNNFKEKNIVKEIKSIGDIIKSVELSYSSIPSPRVILTIIFSVTDILIRWSKLEDPSRLVIDFFRKNELEKLQNRGKGILQAQNFEQKNNKDFRILVDAGHGGSDFGAQGFFLLKEKDLTLDIARRVHNELKKNGFNVYLTRNDDQTLTLKERNELAGQLNADLFVSIHVNAVPSVSDASGLESYFLNPQDLLAKKRRGGFLFIFEPKDKKLAKFANEALKNNIDLSEKLASNIHMGMINFLNDKKVSNVIDKGVKKNDFRLLLRSEVPATLIEVGFVTNKKEAKRLSSPVYRQMLAIGIFNGIEKYIKDRS